MIYVNGMTNKLLMLPCVLLLLTACVTAPVRAPAAAPVVDVAAQRLAEQQAQLEQQQAQRRHQLREMLANAQQALAEDRLKAPFYDNAYSWYQQVLAIDELNEEAHQGMRLITDRYLQLAEQAYSSGRIHLAQQLLNGAESIAAPPSIIEPLRERYSQHAGSNEVYLPVKALSARNQDIQTLLAELAGQLTPQQRLLIVARNDSEGRWIYQQMRQSVSDFRLRGNIELGRIPRILIIDM